MHYVMLDADAIEFVASDDMQVTLRARARQLTGCPVIVVLAPRDWTPDQVAAEIRRIEQEEDPAVAALIIAVRVFPLAPRDAVERLGQAVVRYALGQIDHPTQREDAHER